jgi:transcriptional regulator with XRE-family HTH domain
MRLRKWRLTHFMTQRDLAIASGVAESSIIRLEAGRSAANFATIRRLASPLGLEPKTLAWDEPPEVPENTLLRARD